MTVSTNLNESTFLGDGASTVFTFGFDCGPGGNRVSSSEIKAYLIDATTGLPVLQTGYTVAFNPTSAGGTVTLTGAPALNIAGVIRRELDFLQPEAFNLSANLDERAIEKMGDRATFELQDVLQRTERSPQMPFGTSADFDGQISGVAVSNSALLAQLDGDSNVIGFKFGTKDIDALGDDLDAAVATAVAAAATSTTNAAAAGTAATAAQLAASQAQALVGGATTYRFTPLQFGGVGNGTADDTAAVQAMNDAASARAVLTGANAICHLPAGYIFKVTNSVRYDSNTTWLMEGFILHGFTGGTQGALIGRNSTTDGGATQVNVHFQMAGGGIKFDSRGTASRKGLEIDFCDGWSLTNCSVTGNDGGSYDLHVRNSSNGVMLGGYNNAGNSTGEDGLHFSRNCSNIRVSGFLIKSGDDAFSITHETNSTTYVINNITVDNCIFLTNNNSAMKLLIDTSSSGAKINDIYLNNCYFGIHDGAGAGGAISMLGASTDVAGIQRINFTGGGFSCPGGTYGGNSCLAQNVTNVNFIGMQGNNLNSRAILFSNAFDCTVHNCVFKDVQAAAVLVNATITAVTWRSGSTVDAQFGLATDLSPLTAITNMAITITGCVNPENNGTFTFIDFDNTTKKVGFSVDTNTRGSAAKDESGLTANGQVGKRGLEMIGVTGGDNLRITGNMFDNPGTTAIRMTALSGVSPTNTLVDRNTFKNCVNSFCIDIQASKFGYFGRNRTINCTARSMINLIASAAVDTNTLELNEDLGTIHCRTSYLTPNVNSFRDIGNRGTNPTKLFGTITIAAGATTATVVLGVYDTPCSNASANLEDNMMTVNPIGTAGTANDYWITVATRTFTLHSNAAPGGAGWPFKYTIDGGRRAIA